MVTRFPVVDVCEVLTAYQCKCVTAKYAKSPCKVCSFRNQLTAAVTSMSVYGETISKLDFLCIDWWQRRFCARLAKMRKSIILTVIRTTMCSTIWKLRRGTEIFHMQLIPDGLL